MKRLAYFGLFCLYVAGWTTAIVPVVQAEDFKLKQQILPLDCIFETINDGYGTIHYLTPKECGVPEEPTPKSEVPLIETIIDVGGSSPIVDGPRFTNNNQLTPDTQPDLGSSESSVSGSLAQVLGVEPSQVNKTRAIMAISALTALITVIVIVVAL